jgi:uncharacterized membrane protein YphA (DoxX/SURF4 family)
MREKIANILNNKIALIMARFILGGVFIYASIDKISFPKEFAHIVTNYHILPEILAIYFAFFLPWVELLLGIFLIVGLFVRESSLILSLLIFGFTGAIIIKSFNGSLDNCGCFSVHQQGSNRGLFFIISRDILLLILGTFLFVSNKSRMHNSAQK